MASTPQSSGDYTANERRALVRQLTNMLNQRELDRRQFNEHFSRYGILLEGLFTRLDDQKDKINQLEDLVTKIYRLGIWWEHDARESIVEEEEISV